MLVETAVRDVMQAPVETIDPDESVRLAADRLTSAAVGSLVVCEADEPVGIVTEGDVTELVASGDDPGQATVESIMATPLITVDADAPIEAAATLLQDHAIKRLPVLEDDALVGIVTTTDLSAYLPHLVRRGRAAADPSREPGRSAIRVDTAYEDEDWTFEYHGDEETLAAGDAVTFAKTLTADDVEVFAEASGDTNRLHLDETYAAATRFGERIVHGTLVGGTISAALARLPGLTIYLSQDLSYLGPVPIGERVTATCEVLESLGPDRYRLATSVERPGGEMVLDGEASVLSDPLPAIE